jgi:protein gp37
MNKAHWHTFQVLTKRAERISLLNSKINWTKNIWLGVTVENNRTMQRIDHLRKSSAFIKFLSLEPLLEDMKYLELDNIDWVIVGGESGYKSRPIQESWVENIRKFCDKQRVPFFFKQWGGKNKKKAGRLLNNRTYDEMPIKNEINIVTQ